jgi:hypothetical protein
MDLTGLIYIGVKLKTICADARKSSVSIKAREDHCFTSSSATGTISFEKYLGVLRLLWFNHPPPNIKCFNLNDMEVILSKC